MFSLRVPNRAAIEFALKAGIATIVSVGLSRWIGLNSPYWAGISAVVATAGSLGASINASITRIVATLIALAIAVLVVLLPIDGLVLAGVTVTFTLLVMSALRLDAGARLAGASTLLLTAVPQDDPLSVALGRGLNVPLGCLVAVAVGLVVFPRRAVTRLRIGMTEDFVATLRITADALDQWIDGTASSDLETRLEALLADVATRDATYTEASFEPGGTGRQAESLSSALDLTTRLSRICRSIVIVVTRAESDSIQRLLEPEIRGVLDALHGAVGTVDEGLWRDTATFSDAIAERLRPSVNDLDIGFRRLRAERATAPFSDAEVEHLLHAIWCVHRFCEAFEEPAT